ncbi:M81 family metallopeptidase [Anatilimnocola floriformis]|uniref:M81 family metallopeptidase n=1 Tax=Anatilimnocola floriformis TaxID=2948575 RepID=UPI0020C2AE28|nr:M81 family metallopeptidase [Anatilimnocola floriformis]
MRIGIIALLQESNTFIAQPTQLSHFEQDMLVTGDAMRERLQGTHHEVGGMFHALEDLSVTPVPIFAARAFPFASIERLAAEELLRRMFAALDEAGRIDGLLVAPHGATVSEPWPDFDGYWLTELRKKLGPDLPIIGTLDPHGNLSPAMVAACNALIAYRTNPHLDQRARGVDAARLIVKTVRGDLKPTMAVAYPPLTINIERQCTHDEPCHSLYKFADEQLNDDSVLSNSIMLGFPYADVAEMGTSLIAVTNNDLDLAQRLANQLANYLWQHRQDFEGHLLSVDQALDQASHLTAPLCLLDMGDNVGGGSPGDGTWLANAISERGLHDAFVCLYDPAAVEQCVAAGVGGKLRLEMGGKTDNLHGPPLVDEVEVLGLYDGQFEETQARHGGFTKMDQGPTAVVLTSRGLTVMLTTRRAMPYSLKQITTFGIEPAKFKVLVAKGVNAPLAAYKEACKSFLKVNTAGCTSADLTQFAYHRRRQPLYPLERDFEWAAS